MIDNAQKISGQIWQWYKRCRDTKKDNETWKQLLDEGQGIVHQYEESEADHVFAKDMYLIFLDRIERIERGELNNG